MALICSKQCLFVCHTLNQLTNPWTACLSNKRGQISAPMWQGGTSHSASMVISRCHSPQRRSEGFLTSVRKKGQSLLHPPAPSFFSCWGSSNDRSDREKKRGITGRDREGYIGGQGETSPQPVDAPAKDLAMESPIQLQGREKEKERERGKRKSVGDGCEEDMKWGGGGK